MHKVNVSIPKLVSFVSVDFDFYSDIRIFFGGFTAAKIRRQIRLADFFSADIRRTKIRRLIQIFGGGLGISVTCTLTCTPVAILYTILTLTQTLTRGLILDNAQGAIQIHVYLVLPYR